MGSHPRAAKFASEVGVRPRSYGTAAYFGNNAFVFVDGRGKKQVVRYQTVPVAGVVNLDSAAAARAGENYLQVDIQRRVARAPVEFRLYAQLRMPVIPPTTAPSSGRATGSGCSWAPSD